jgi:hypothetical protein
MDHAMFPSLSLYIAVLQSRAAQFPKGNNRPSLRLSPAESLYASRHRLYTHSQHTHTTHCVCVSVFIRMNLIAGHRQQLLDEFLLFVFFSC